MTDDRFEARLRAAAPEPPPNDAASADAQRRVDRAVAGFAPRSGRRWRSRNRLAVLAAAAVLVGGGAAYGAWTLGVSQGEVTRGPSGVAVDGPSLSPDGTLGLWNEQNGPGDGDWRVVAGTIGPDGRRVEPVVLSERGYNPMIGEDAAGNPFAIWRQPRGLAWARTVDGRWGESAPVPGSAAHVVRRWSVVSGPTATALVWEQQGPPDRIWLTVHRDGAWSTPQSLPVSKGGDLFSPTIAVSADGAVVAAYLDINMVEDTAAAVVVQRDTNGEWSDPVVLGVRTEVDKERPGLAVHAAAFDGEGRPMVLWSGPTPRPQRDVGRLMLSRGHGDGWDVPILVARSRERGFGMNPSLAPLGSDGLVLWAAATDEARAKAELGAAVVHDRAVTPVAGIRRPVHSATWMRAATDQQGRIALAWSSGLKALDVGRMSLVVATGDREAGITRVTELSRDHAAVLSNLSLRDGVARLTWNAINPGDEEGHVRWAQIAVP